MKTVAILAMLGASLAHGATCTNLPAGAEALGYTNSLFNDEPNLTSVSATGTDLTSKWYAGEPGHSTTQNMAQREKLSTVNGQLAIPLGAAILSTTPKSTAGGTPLLDGSKGFYVEVTMHLSGNDADNFYGISLLPVEHNAAKADHFSGDAGYERWTEIDVSASGYGPGSHASVINWWGTYPRYGNQVLNNYGHDAKLDFTQEHRYGVSYDPAKNVIQWYVDDVPTWKEPATAITKNFHFLISIDSNSHGANKPYTLYLHSVAAYTK